MVGQEKGMEQLPLFSSTGNLEYAVRLVEKSDDCQYIRRHSLDIAILRIYHQLYPFALQMNATILFSR